jgi:muramoyltetrapeptide carboxypeptidase
MKEGQQYQSQAWLNAMTNTSYDLVPSQEWSSDPWYDPTQPRHFMPTEWKVYNAGKASGTIIGGNLSTFGLLRGTPYAPQVNDYVLFLEQAEEDDYLYFDRNLAAILQAYPNPKAVLIGRFPKECQMTSEILLYILDKHPLLKTRIRRTHISEVSCLSINGIQKSCRIRIPADNFRVFGNQVVVKIR